MNITNYKSNNNIKNNFLNFKKFVFIFIAIFLYSSVPSHALEVSKCNFELENFQKYKKDLVSCFEKSDKILSEDLLTNLSSKNTNFLSEAELKKKSFLKNDKLIISEKFETFLEKTIKDNFLSIYKIHGEINNLKIKKLHFKYRI